MKDKLTSADPAGWYEATDSMKYRGVYWWTGANLIHYREAQNGLALMLEQFTDYRRLVEAAEPEVIEGDGVKVLPDGIYWVDNPTANSPYIVNVNNIVHRAVAKHRYIRIPDPHFPPRKPEPPPKPELVLVQRNKDSCSEWAFDRGDFVLCFGGTLIAKSACWKVGAP